jgi:hypothetical protein
MSKAVLFAKNCIICGSAENLSTCSGCKVVLYCSVACQTEDWPTHRTPCKLRREFCKDNFETPFLCYECQGPTTVFDYSCVCLKTFCSDRCRARSPHVLESEACKRDCQGLEKETNDMMQKLKQMELANLPMEFMHEEMGSTYYKAARLLKFGIHQDKALSRCLMINSARLSCKWAVIEVGQMKSEEVVEGAIYDKI